MSNRGAPTEITPQILLRAYSIGMFPMAESADDEELFWVEPRERAVFPLDGFVVSRSLAKTVRRDVFEVRIDHDFDAVIDACAAPAPGRANTWINGEIRRLYRALFQPRSRSHRGVLARGATRGRALWRRLGRGVLWREHVPPRDRRLEGRSDPSRRAAARRRISPARHAIHDVASRLARGSGNFAQGISAVAARRDGAAGREFPGVAGVASRSAARGRSKRSATLRKARDRRRAAARTEPAVERRAASWTWISTSPWVSAWPAPPARRRRCRPPPRWR